MFGMLFGDFIIKMYGVGSGRERSHGLRFG